MNVEKDERWTRLTPTEPGVTSGRHAQVVDATMRLIAREGVAALSTRKIARAVPINLATLHNLVGSKDDLLLAVLDAATSAMIGALVAAVHPGGELRMALMESFTALVALLDQSPALPLVCCEVLLYAGRRPGQTASAFQQQQRFLDALETCYRVACTQGEQGLIACDELASVVASSIDGLALQLAAGVPLALQEATRAQVLRALLALAPATTGP